MGVDVKLHRWIQAFSCGLAPDDAVAFLDVGDHSRLRQLATMNEEIAAGKCSACVVTGEKGVGKTHTRVLHSAQSSDQNIPTVLVATTPLVHENLDPYKDWVWMSAMDSVQIGTNRGLLSVIKPLVPSLRDRGINCDAKELFLRMRSEVPEDGHDLLFVLLMLAFALDSDDRACVSSASSWLYGLSESHAESIEAIGVRTLIQDYSWYERFYHLGSALRALGYSGLLVQFDDFWGGGRNATRTERGEIVHQMLSLLDKCSRQLYPGIGFNIYIGSGLEETMRHEAAFANLAERASGLARRELEYRCVDVPDLDRTCAHEFLLKVASVFARDSCYAKAFASMTKESAVERYMEAQGDGSLAPGPLMQGFVIYLESRLHS